MFAFRWILFRSKLRNKGGLDLTVAGQLTAAPIGNYFVRPFHISYVQMVPLSGHLANFRIVPSRTISERIM